MGGGWGLVRRDGVDGQKILEGERGDEKRSKKKMKKMMKNELDFEKSLCDFYV